MNEKDFKVGCYTPSAEGKNNLQNRKKRIIFTTTVVVLALVVLLVVAGLVYYKSKIGLLQYNDGTVSKPGEIAETDEEVIAESAAMEQALKDLEEKQAIEAEGDIFGDEDVFNILLIGTDDRTKEFSDNARGDTCMLMSINKKNMAVKLVSFERGMGVPILDGTYKGQYDWLTHTFRYGGADLMMREIRECFKIDVQHYVRANIYTFMQLVDSVGGIDIELTQEEADYINHPEGTYGEYHIQEMGVSDQIQTVSLGRNHLNGATAMLYARCRYIDNDWHRVERQRNVIQAAIYQTQNLNVLELDSMLNNVLPMVQTNLTEKEITSLMLLAPRYQGITLEQMTIPTYETCWNSVGVDGRKMIGVDFEANAQILKEFFYGVS